MTTDELLKKNLQIRQRNEAEFRRVFGVPLHRYWNNFSGFDITGFDDDVVKSGAFNVRDTVKHKWGNAGLKVIMNLLGVEE